jgi:hypothetical protein
MTDPTSVPPPAGLSIRSRPSRGKPVTNLPETASLRLRVADAVVAYLDVQRAALDARGDRLADERAGIAVPSLQRTTRQLERDDRAQPVSIWCGIGFASASVHVATKREPRAIATAKTSAVRRDVDQRDVFRRSGSGARSGH